MEKTTTEPLMGRGMKEILYWGFPPLVALIVAFGWLGRAGIVVYDEAFFSSRCQYNYRRRLRRLERKRDRRP